MKIKEEFKKLIPALSVEEYKQLEENCLAEGIRESIITWNGYIIDGHNRYEIATRWNLEYETETKRFKDENEVKLWMIDNQNGRRNLTDGWKYKLQQIKKEILLLKGKENISANKGGTATLSTIDKEVHNTRQIIAKSLNWSTGKVAMADIVFKKATPELEEKVLNNEVTINQAYQDIKKEEKQQIKTDERERLAEIGKTKKIDIDFRLGDFEEVFKDIPDGSIDCIITDPPYPYEFIEVWSKLSRVAKRVLKPNGYCIAYSGQMNLPEVIKRMNEHLNYYWTFSLIHTGSRQLINGRNLFCGWKPILVFQNGFKKLDKPFDDFIMGTGMEKTHHKWQQAELELKHLINNFTKEGDVIMEPFAGGGTTIIAALKLNRNIIAAEIDETSYNVSKQRISEWKS
jgi:16S rRNA G966 N2-methylase RsmD